MIAVTRPGSHCLVDEDCGFTKLAAWLQQAGLIERQSEGNTTARSG
jgi:hypothetical protein